MVVNDVLAEWLGSGSARAATQAAVETLGGEIASIPALAALKRGLAPALAGGADAVLALARAFIDDDSAIAGLVAASVAAATADPFCAPPLRASRNDVQDGLLLFSHSVLTVQLAALSADSLAIKRGSGAGLAPIAFTGQRTLFRFLKGGGAILSIWETPFVQGPDGEPCRHCRLRERRRLADGDAFEIDGRRESFAVEQAEFDLVYAVASTSLEAGPVATEYDPRTMELIATSSTDDAGSRTQMMLALLRALGRADSAPLFPDLLRSGHFFARWQAMREFLAIDAELALPHLRAMAGSDPHPQVRAAATETLAAFFPETPVPCPA
jgi:HEAT repeat protein